MSFASLGLSDALVRAVAATGYTTPTPVQTQAIPAVLEGRDLMVAAQTGTGKTAGFSLPILELLFPNGQRPADYKRVPRKVRALVLTPTRELAAQVHDNIRSYATELQLHSACIFGGVGANPQMKAIAPGLDILVACPGRLLDLVGQRAVDLSAVEFFVLDEADRMLDMGFIHDVKKVIAKLPAKRQNLLFSATFSAEITELTNRLLHNPARIQVTPLNTTVERIEQRVYRVQAGHKRALVAHLITMGAWEQVLVFTRTKHGANRLAEYLDKNGLPAAAIHGNKSQSARTKALADFKANKIRVLVATDIAARGLDIDQLPHVVNFELPNVSEDYVHRIGRTGRAGRSGEAVSLVSPDEEKLLKAIERLTRQKFEEGSLEGFVPPAQAELNSDRPERPRGAAPANGRNQRRSNNAGGQPRGQGGRNDKPRSSNGGSNNKPRRPQQARPGIAEPEDAVARERRLQAMGNRAVPDAPKENRQRSQREKPALLGS
ncbi:ATP-dependent RNA helicase RhlE [Halopseudomonas bauzanensis]|uniref:DEAD-box ATP-dependent RNA helicase RhpA n=1 Tax=Halopseudomonas bauzanensis TaxID=653930 RepID=A0A1H9NUS3_9GAMM|nr:ATP-dependent RNA helicase RhlE [Halopseudomonas bauzanensis]SFL78411.1 ATP-dependent RNA helicase RhlE [Halopseudomonas bauzanensis]